MIFDEAVLNVLVYSAFAAGIAGLGALLPASERLVGLAYAIASGLMLGASHLLIVDTIGAFPVLLLGGALAGVLYTWWASRFSRSAAAGYRVLLQSGLHGSAEGVALGVAFVLDVRTGIFVALVLALHNIAEAFVLSEQLRAEGLAFGNATALAIATNLGQPLFALAIWALSPLIAPLLPTALGFAAAAMTFLVLTELLPTSYESAGRGTIAVATSLGAAAVVLAESILL